MLTRRRIAKASAWTALTLFVLGEIEAEGRRHPWLMPAQWQVVQFAVDYPFSPLRDAELGFSMPPNKREVVRTADFTFLFETDSNGYPNRDPWPSDPTVVFLGDSLITGQGVGRDGSFTGLLAGMLPDQSLLNLGLAGAGPERQARIYRRFGAAWHPDVVVSCLFLASDFDNDVHFLSWLREGQGTDYDTYRLGMARAAHRRGVFRRVLDNSLVLDRAVRVMLPWIRGGDSLERSFRFADGTEILFERHALEFATVATSPTDPRLDAFADSLERLRGLVEQNGARLVLMLIPSKEEVFGATASRTRLNLASQMKDRLAARRFAVLDLYPAFRRQGAAQPSYYPRDLHLNEYGNRIVAEEFAAWFSRQSKEAAARAP